MRMLKSSVFVLFLFCAGCSFSIFGAKKDEPIPKKLKKDLGKLDNSLPPRKSFGYKEAEKEVLYLAKNVTKDASELSSEFAVKDRLVLSNKLLDSLSRSLGMPSAAIQETVDAINVRIENLDKQNLVYRKQNAEYIGKMEENSRLINRLQGVIEYKTQKEATLLGKISFWFWTAVVLCVLFAVFVPGGMILVKRFWSKSMEMFTYTAKKSANAIGEMSHALADYMAEVDEVEKKKLKDRLNKMKKGATEYWDSVRSGENPLLMELHNIPDKLKKKVLNE